MYGAVELGERAGRGRERTREGEGERGLADRAGGGARGWVGGVGDEGSAGHGVDEVVEVVGHLEFAALTDRDFAPFMIEEDGLVLVAAEAAIYLIDRVGHDGVEFFALKFF